MVKVNLQDLKKLREETAASIADCRRALEESDGDYNKALDWIKKNAADKAAKKEGRETSQGIIDSYIHGNGKIGVLTEILCETDFVAKTEEFKNLAHEISMQVASMDPKDVDSLLEQDYIRDPSMKINDLIKQVIGKLGENIKVARFIRFEI